MYALLSRLGSPVGFVLALICFLLPFVTVSCDTTVVDYEATYHGTDFVVGGVPEVTVSGRDGTAVEPDQDARVAPQALAVLAVVAVVVGIVVSLLPYRRLVPRPAMARTAMTAAAAVIALVSLVANQLVVTRRIVDELHTSDDVPISRSTAEDMVDTRYGFWLALTVLAAVSLVNLAEFGWRRLTATR